MSIQPYVTLGSILNILSIGGEFDVKVFRNRISIKEILQTFGRKGAYMLPNNTFCIHVWQTVKIRIKEQEGKNNTLLLEIVK